VSVQGPLDGDPQGGAVQSVATPILRTASRRGQTGQGRGYRSNAKVVARGLECRYASPTVRSACGRQAGSRFRPNRKAAFRFITLPQSRDSRNIA
jgi:hypothetical protein